MNEQLETVEEILEQDTTILTHMVHCPDEWDTAQQWVDEARAKGLEVEALCGHTWVPKSDPVKHPLCPTCLDIAQIRLA